MQISRPQLRLHAAILLLFAAVTLAHTYPMWLTPGSVLNELWDVRLNTWTLAWDAHALVTDPGSIFDANVFHPHANTLAFSENLIGTAIVVAPLNWLGHPVLAYNIALLLSLWLTGVATAYWVRELTGRTDAGIIAGMAWSFSPVRFDHLPQLQLLAAPWFSLSLLALALYARTRKGRYLIGASLLLAWQYAAGVQLTLLLLPLAGIYAARLALPQLRELARRRSLAHGLVAAVLFVAITAPISLPYLEVREAEGFVREIADMSRYSAQPVSLLSPSGFQKASHMRALHGRYRRTEGNFFPGLVVTALAIAGLIASSRARPRSAVTDAPDIAQKAWERGRRAGWQVSAAAAAGGGLAYGLTLLLAQWWERPPWADSALGFLSSTHPSVLLFVALLITLLLWRPSPARPPWSVWGLTFAGIAVLMFLLATGPRPTAWNSALGIGPFQLLYDALVPYQSIRAIGRFGMTMMLALSVVAGVGYARIASRWAQNAAARGALLALVVALIAAEVRVFPFPTVEAGLDEAPLYDALAQLPGAGAVVHVPLMPNDFPPDVTRYMLGSARHWRPLVNGYSGFLTAGMVQLSTYPTLGKEFFDHLRRDFATEWIAVHGDLLPDFASLLPGLMQSEQVEVVHRWGNTLLLRLLPAIDRGGIIARRVAAWQLDRGEPLRFELRAGPGQPETEVELTVGGEIVAIVDANRTFDQFSIPMPTPVPRAANGTVTLVWRTRPPAQEQRPIGQTGSMIRRDVLVDAQDASLSIAIDDVFVRRVAAAGFLAARLQEDPSQSPPTRHFEPTRRGLRELAGWISALPSGTRVALAFRAEGDEVLSGPAWADTLSALGSALEPGDPVVHGAILSVVGAGTGAALEHFAAGRAWVRAGPLPDRYPRFALRDIRLPYAAGPGESGPADGR